MNHARTQDGSTKRTAQRLAVASLLFFSLINQLANLYYNSRLNIAKEVTQQTLHLGELHLKNAVLAITGTRLLGKL